MQSTENKPGSENKYKKKSGYKTQEFFFVKHAGKIGKTSLNSGR